MLVVVLILILSIFHIPFEESSLSMCQTLSSRGEVGEGVDSCHSTYNLPETRVFHSLVCHIFGNTAMHTLCNSARLL